MFAINQISLQTEQLGISKTEARYTKLFWLGFTAYAIGFSFAHSGHLSVKMLQGLQSLGLILVFVYGSRIALVNFDDAYLKIIFRAYLLWQVLIIFRGLSVNYDFAKKTLFDGAYGMMAYLTPLIYFLPRKIATYRRLFDVIVLFALIYFAYDALCIRDLLSGDRSGYKNIFIVEYSLLLSLPAGFLLLTFPYHTKKRLLLAAATLVAILFFSVYRARRGMVLICTSQLIFAFLLYFFKAKNKIAAFVFSGAVILAAVFLAADSYVNNRASIFNYLAERGKQDTRTGVEVYFYNDMDTRDWIVGKGINGQYFCPNVEEDSTTAYRTVIETGYLQIILNGGIVGLALLLLIAIPAMFKGLFYSRNILSKAAGIWILLWIFYLYPATMQVFSLYYAIFWLCIGICYSKSIRNLSENNLKMLFLTRTVS
jgi:hypothetical protein